MLLAILDPLGGLWRWISEHLLSWDAGVAIGTLALAVSTLRLAQETRQLSRYTRDEVVAAEAQARAAASQAETARLQLESASRPVLVDVRIDPSAGDEGVSYVGLHRAVNSSTVDVIATADYLHVSIPIRNVGVGIAFVDRARLRSYDVEWEGRASATVVPPGETARISFSIPHRATRYADFHAQIEQSGALELEIDYSDASGRPQPQTRLAYARTDLQGWVIERVVLLGAWTAR